mmetsp:Transcript_5883/g.14047  ORF Transcript_5883/g.14047 Transcript_5883/m.14047 type:complete len:189 (-) Transcript_5883:228-794(-)
MTRLPSAMVSVTGTLAALDGDVVAAPTVSSLSLAGAGSSTFASAGGASLLATAALLAETGGLGEAAVSLASGALVEPTVEAGGLITGAVLLFDGWLGVSGAVLDAGTTGAAPPLVTSLALGFRGDRVTFDGLLIATSKEFIIIAFFRALDLLFLARSCSQAATTASEIAAMSHVFCRCHQGGGGGSPK